MIQTNNNQMTSEQFVYWLQGFFEMTDAKELSTKQIEMIKQHLGYVFSPAVTSIIPPPAHTISGASSFDSSGLAHLGGSGSPYTTVIC